MFSRAGKIPCSYLTSLACRIHKIVFAGRSGQSPRVGIETLVGIGDDIADRNSVALNFKNIIETVSFEILDDCRFFFTETGVTL